MGGPYLAIVEGVSINVDFFFSHLHFFFFSNCKNVRTYFEEIWKHFTQLLRILGGVGF